MIYVGDVHGKVGQLEWQLRHDPSWKDKQIFQVGDMGVGFKGVSFDYKWSKDRLLFIRGNHDSPEACRQHPNYAGDFGYIPKEKLFYCGGAWSIDQAWRTEGVTWWKDEELDAVELNKAFQLYKECKPEIVATHEAPTRAAIILLNQIMLGLGPKDKGESDPVRVPHSADYAYYKEKVGCKNTRTSQVFQQMLDVWGPKHWVFGHYHVRMDFELQGCMFHCLPELEKLEIDNADL